MIYPLLNTTYASYYNPFVSHMKRRESGGQNVDSKGRLIRNPNSSAKGIYQIVDSTWKSISSKLGRTLNRYSLDDNESAMHYLFNEYCNVLKSRTLPINNTTLYCVHFTGSTDFIWAAIRNPNAGITTVFSNTVIQANKWLIRLGTLGAVVNNFAKSVNGPTIDQLSDVKYLGKTNGYSYSRTDAEKPAKLPDKTIICKKSQTVEEFIEDNNILMDTDELMSYLSNSKNIYNSYNQEQKEQYKKANKELIVSGAKIIVPQYQIAAPKSIYVVNQTIIENKKYTAFVEKEIKKLLNNPDYKKINVFDGEFGSINKRLNNASVWVWTKSTDLKKGSHLIDITPFLVNLTTNVGENGGNFSITLPNLNYETNGEDFDIPFDWMKSEMWSSFVSKNSLHKITNFSKSDVVCDFKDDNDRLKENNKILTRNLSFFSHLLQNNDIVFIRFEKLKNDKNYHNNFTSNSFFKVPSSSLPNNVYDMIGLIDNVSLSTQANTGTQVISVQGRDLSKLLIDDSIYNYIVGYGVQDSEQIIQNSNQDKDTGRVAINVDGEDYNVGNGIAQDLEFNFFQTHSIDEWIVFIMSQLTNTTIAPDMLFNSYDNRSMITSRQNSMNGSDFKYKETLASGIWQIVKMCFDYETTKRRLADDSLSTNTGSLINMIRKFAQKPFIEFSMDTYGDRFYFLFRKPPWTKESFISNPCINIFEEDVINENLVFDDEVYSMYQLDAMGSMIDASNGQNLIIQPAILFNEYKKIFGLNKLQITSNYLDFDASVSNLTDANLEHIIKQQTNDLEWIIQSYSYLPFTRKGTIVINGDRRIKRGMSIRNMGTGEVFLVDNVSNHVSFNESNERITTLQVSRGIVEKHIDKYFNVVYKKKMNDKYRWLVNSENFEFLLTRGQFK